MKNLFLIVEPVETVAVTTCRYIWATCVNDYFIAQVFNEPANRFLTMISVSTYRAGMVKRRSFLGGTTGIKSRYSSIG